MSMVQTVFLLVDVQNNKIDDKFIALTEDVDKAREYVIGNWEHRIKPELGVHMFEMTQIGDGVEEYRPTERGTY